MSTKTIITKLWICLIFTIISINIYAQENTDCNRKVNSSYLSKILQKSVCIPRGYTIFNVVDSVDLSNDGIRDLVVAWTKLPLNEGDTTFYSIYLQQKDSVFRLKKIFHNLQSIYMTEKSKGENSFLDSLRKLYTGSTEVFFKTNTIIIKFPITWDYFGKSYVFHYDSSMKTWMLQKVLYWVGNVDYGLINKYHWNDKLHEENLLKEVIIEYQLSIDNFDLTKVMVVEGEEDWFYLNAHKKFDWF